MRTSFRVVVVFSLVGLLFGALLVSRRARAEAPASPLLLQDFRQGGEQARLAQAFAEHERRRLGFSAAKNPEVPASTEAASRTLRAARTLLATPPGT